MAELSGYFRPILLLIAIQSAAAFGIRCDFVPFAPEHGTLNYSPVAGALLGMSAKEDSVRRTGILIKTDKGREILLVSRFMAAAGHHGMNAFLEQHLPPGEKLADILWSGELGIARNPVNSSWPQITQVNTTSGFAAEWFRKQGRDPSENKSENLLAALRRSQPQLIAAEVRAKDFDPNDPKQDEHLDRFMSAYVRKMKELRKSSYDKEMATWIANGKTGTEPKYQTPNFRHDIKEMVDPVASSLSLIDLVAKMGNNPAIAAAKKGALDMIRKYAEPNIEFLRLLHEDGVAVKEGNVDHLERARTGLIQLNANGETSGMTVADLVESFRAVHGRYNQLGRLTDGKNAAKDPAERSLLPENVQMIELAAPSP